ncbi:hypothetical protein PG987_002777 [Apiospora arundinis]
MIDSSRASTSIKLLLSLVVFGCSLYYFGALEASTLIQHEDEKGIFVGNFLENEANGDFDGESITSLCSAKNWTKGLVFNCDAPSGGIGVVRNVHLNCIRFAMEAGAELIIPEIVRRDDKNIAKVVPDPKGAQRGEPPDYFYDRGHLNWALSTFCPQMKVYWSIDELFDTPVARSIPFRLDDLGLDRVDQTVIAQPENWASEFNKYLDFKSNPKTRLYPFMVNVAQTRYVWPTSYDSPAFVRSLGRILRFRKDVRELAASVFFSLRKRLDESRGGQGVEGNSDTNSTLGFVGVHLHEQEDLWDSNIPSYEEQAEHYLHYMVESRNPFAYLAPGITAEHVTSFTERSREVNITVVTKRDLLDPDEIGYLSNLSWDQQSLVDYELLLRADRMVGSSGSSFPWSIALRRGTAGGTMGSQAGSSEDSQIRWQDARSAIMGKADDYNKNMEKTTWP